MAIKERNLYAYNALKSNRCFLDQETSFLHSSIINLDNEIDSGHVQLVDFAPRLLDILNSRSHFLPIDRVCVVLTHTNSKTLKVISSANSDNLKPNIMTTAYSCLVSGNSSLGNLQKTNMRIYSDISAIVDRYEGKPLQRSLKRLKDMGVKSGLTIPLSVFGIHSGIIFLNSSEVGTFDELRDEHYATLCLIKMIANNLLYRTVYKVTAVESYIVDMLNEFSASNIFDGQAFKTCLEKFIAEKFGKTMSLEINLEAGPKVLFNFIPICCLIVRSLEMGNHFSTRSALELNVKFQSSPNGQQIVFEIPQLKLSPKKLSYLQSLDFLPGQSMVLSADSFQLVNDVELVFGDLDYSV